ncbi:MAG: hypothetical protein AAFU85_06120, partial [Planctomycetota bacterium]
MADESTHELIDEIADEFLTRSLQGTQPEIGDYVRSYPWLADEIRELFPMLRYLESTKDPRSSFRTPQSVGPYRIGRELGRGGMGIVYEGK